VPHFTVGGRSGSSRSPLSDPLPNAVLPTLREVPFDVAVYMEPWSDTELVVEGVTGPYSEDCNEAGPYRPGIRRGVAGYALRPEPAARLWQV